MERGARAGGWSAPRRSRWSARRGGRRLGGPEGAGQQQQRGAADKRRAGDSGRAVHGGSGAGARRQRMAASPTASTATGYGATGSVLDCSQDTTELRIGQQWQQRLRVLAPGRAAVPRPGRRMWFEVERAEELGACDGGDALLSRRAPGAGGGAEGH